MSNGKIYSYNLQLPDKTIASLVKHYYSWKKTRSRNNGFDRPDKIKMKDGSENGSEIGSNEDSDNEDKVSFLNSQMPHDESVIH